MTTIVKHWIPSPNHGARGAAIDLLVVHYSAGHGGVHAMGRVFAMRSRQASAHYGVDRDGLVAQYVSEDRKAWHAGDGLFPMYPDRPRDAAGNALADTVNARSIGIELCNRGWASSKYGRARTKARHRNPLSRSASWEAYPEEQIAALRTLVTEIRGRHFGMRYVTGHEDVTNQVTARGSKLDPGPLFPWDALAGLGLKRVIFNFNTERFEVAA
jgi:N-acetylmuramoyl-L-alanine amidase